MGRLCAGELAIDPQIVRDSMHPVGLARGELEAACELLAHLLGLDFRGCVAFYATDRVKELQLDVSGPHD